MSNNRFETTPKHTLLVQGDRQADSQLEGLTPWKPRGITSMDRLVRHVIKFDIIDGLPHIHSAQDYLDKMQLAHYYVKLNGPISWVGGVETDPLGLDEASRLHVDNITQLKNAIGPFFGQLRDAARYEPGNQPNEDQRQAARWIADLYKYSAGIGAKIPVDGVDEVLIDAEATRMIAEEKPDLFKLSRLMGFYAEYDSPEGMSKKIDVNRCIGLFSDRIKKERKQSGWVTGMAIAQMHFGMHRLGAGIEVTALDWEKMITAEDAMEMNPERRLRQMYFMNYLSQLPKAEKPT